MFYFLNICLRKVYLPKVFILKLCFIKTARLKYLDIINSLQIRKILSVFLKSYGFTHANLCIFQRSIGLNKSCLLLALLLFSINAHASLDTQLEKMFMDMHNSTNPESYKTERRGIISGGSLVTRNYITDLNPITVSTPSINAGCGGIDLYGGSFSYINKDEFINFLRAVAANARGYAFSIALSSMCEKCFQHIETLQRKVMALNTYFGNSCQLAQGLVNDSLSAFERQGLNDASLIGQFKGIGDLFELSTDPDSKNVYQKAQSADKESMDAITGNVIWNILLSNSFFQQDTALAESVMSMIGTVITDENGEIIAMAPGGLVSITDLVEGGLIKHYHCDSTITNGCLNLSFKQEKLKGLALMLEEKLIGENFDGSSGIVGKLTTNEGTFTVEELTLINALPQGMFARIRTLASLNRGSAVSYVEATSRALSLTMIKNWVIDLVKFARGGITLSKHPQAKIAFNEATISLEALEQEAVDLSASYGSTKDLIELYELLLKAQRISNYLDVATSEGN